MKKFLMVVIGILAASFSSADDLSSNYGTPLRTGGGRMQTQSSITLGRLPGNTGVLSVMRSAAMAFNDGDVVVSLTYTAAYTGTAYPNLVSYTTTLEDTNLVGVAIVRNGSDTSVAIGEQVDVAIEGNVMVNCAGPTAVTTGDWIVSSATAGKVTVFSKTYPVTNSAYVGALLGRALASYTVTSAGAPIRIQLYRR